VESQRKDSRTIQLSEGASFELMMDEQDFQMKADQALEALDKALGAAVEQHEIEPDFSAGTLTIEFDDPPARFVVSPNSPVRQIWVSALATSFKLDWSEERAEFVLEETGQTLKELMAEAIGKQLGEDVKL
jgi:CyaY protein